MIEVMEYIGYAAAPTAAVWSVGVARTGSLRPIKTYRRDRKIAASDKAIDAAEEDLGNVKVGASKELAIPADVKAPPVYELWDHPAPPIPLLASSLPAAPIGYGWEISTSPGGDDGNPHMKLCLLDLKSSLEVESIETDLLIVRRWKYAQDETYAQYYRKAEKVVDRENERKRAAYHRSSSMMMGYYEPPEPTSATPAQGKVMMANLITPMVDWARVLVLRYIVQRPDETKTNYMLIQHPEEAQQTDD